MNKVEFIEKYCDICDRADGLFKKYNYCEIKDGTCGRFRLKTSPGKNFCCGSCEHLTETGCSVKAIMCKLWICNYKIVPEEFHKTRSILLREFWSLVNKSKSDIGYVDCFRAPMEEIIKKLEYRGAFKSNSK